MAIHMMEKGERYSLEKDGMVSQFKVGLGWKEPTNGSVEFDCDVSVFGLDANEKVVEDNGDHYFIYFKHPEHTGDHSIVHSGDNRTGAGDGDDEVIIISPEKLSPKIQSISFVITIHEALERRQNFGQVKDAYVRIYNETTKEVIAQYDLQEDFSTSTAVQVGSLYKKDNTWRFMAVGAGSKSTLRDFLNTYQ
jgi:tellurium resistance protein TerD